MANKAAFSTDEWNQVLGGAFMAGFAVTAADPSGLWGLFKETFASGRALMEAKSNATASELSKAIVSDMETSEGRSAAQAFVKSRLQGAKREEIKQRAIDALRSAAAIVDQKAPNDAAAYLPRQSATAAATAALLPDLLRARQDVRSVGRVEPSRIASLPRLLGCQLCLQLIPHAWADV